MNRYDSYAWWFFPTTRPRVTVRPVGNRLLFGTMNFAKSRLSRTALELVATTCVVVAGGFLAPSNVVAGVPAPAPPLVAVLPDSCAWTIDVVQKLSRPSPPDDPRQAAAYKRVSAASPRMVRISMEKTGEDLHKETLWENGKTDNLWIYHGWVIFQPIDFATDQATALPVNSRMSPVRGETRVDFPDLSWLVPKAFVKTVTYHGQRCDYYEDKEAPPLVGGDILNPVVFKGARAWIDVNTRLPVAVENDAVLKKYHFPKEAPDRIRLTGIFATTYNNATKAANATGDSAPNR